MVNTAPVYDKTDPRNHILISKSVVLLLAKKNFCDKNWIAFDMSNGSTYYTNIELEEQLNNLPRSYGTQTDDSKYDYLNKFLSSFQK